MKQNYIVDKLTLSDLQQNGKIIIPDFQRGVVWNKEHRKDFIETVKSGDPFGVVLVSQEKPNAPYILIDGLQRLSTLKAYMQRPLDFIDENDKFVDKDKLNDLFLKKYEAKGMQLPKEEKLEKEKKQFLKKMIFLMKSSPETPEAVDIWEEISEFFGIPKESSKYFDVYKIFNKFYNSFVDNLDLPDIIIHAIVYQGPQDRLPTVFENLNTTSVTLSKYEVFSSKWPKVLTVINDDEIIKAVWSKYANLKASSNFEVDSSEEEIRNKGITLFEYCFAFSEILNNEKKPYSFMFSRKKKSTDPTGFDILALACGLSVNKADDLWLDKYLGSSSASLMINLKNALLDAVNFVASTIRPWVFDLKNANIKNNSLYQIYYMIIHAFNNMYTFEPETKTLEPKDESLVSEWKNKFKKYAHKWYLYHHITEYWNKNRQVSDLRRILDGDDGDDMYISNISREQWTEALTSYNNKIRLNSSSRNIDDGIELLLNYLYKLFIKEDKNVIDFFNTQSEKGEKITFDIEHIVPFDKFKKFDCDLPASSLGNLCYLPVKDNRSKRDKTIYDYAEDRPSLTFNPKFLALIDYPSREELEFINCSYDEFIKSYDKLLNSREEKLISRFLDLIMKY